MALRAEDVKKNLSLVVKDTNSGEIQSVVHLNDTKIGTSSSSKSLEVTGDIKTAGKSMGSLNVIPLITSGRLTLTSAIPVTTSDVTAATTLYYTPYMGSQITLWDGSNWRLVYFEEKLILLGLLAASTIVDVFGYFDGTTLALEFGSAWTSSSVRYDEVSLFQGVLSKAGAPTRRYLGTIRTTATTTFEDSVSKRFVWNAYNQVTKFMYVIETTDSWAYTTAAFRQVRATTTNKFEYVTGQVGTPLEATASTIYYSTTSTVTCMGGVGIDSTTVNSAQTWGGQNTAVNFAGQDTAKYQGYPGLGYHAINWLEYGSTAVNFIGDFNVPQYQSGMHGKITG